MSAYIDYVNATVSRFFLCNCYFLSYFLVIYYSIKKRTKFFVIAST